MSNLPIDDATLDELVSGNLRGEEYRQALLAIDSRPHLWRKCALAFLREQALRQDMRALVAGNVDWTESIDDRSAATAVAVSPQRTWYRQSGRGVVQRLATLAALLLVSFSVGWLGAGLRVENQNLGGGGTFQADMLGATAPTTTTAGQNAQPGGGDLSVAPAFHDNRLRDNRVSDNQGRTLLFGDQLTPLDLEVPPELRQLEEMGYIRIESFDAIMPVTLPDGTSAIFPVRQLRVTPELYSY